MPTKFNVLKLIIIPFTTRLPIVVMVSWPSHTLANPYSNTSSRLLLHHTRAVIFVTQGTPRFRNMHLFFSWSKALLLISSLSSSKPFLLEQKDKSAGADHIHVAN